MGSDPESRRNDARVATPVGVISIESPVRRAHGEVFDFAEMQRIAAFARERRIGLHLDGARVFLATAYTGITPAEYSALFDTVYVSLYKYFNAAGGAVQGVSMAYLTHISGQAFKEYFARGQSWGDGGMQAALIRQFDLNSRAEFLQEFAKQALQHVSNRVFKPNEQAAGKK